MKFSQTLALANLLWLCASANLCGAEKVRIDERAFGTPIACNYSLYLPADIGMPDWQAITTTLPPAKETEFQYPARYIVTNLQAVAPMEHKEVRILAIDIRLGGHTSYFRPVCGVRVTLVVASEAEDRKPVRLYATSNFVGSFKAEYFRTEEAKRNIRNAILECLRGLRPEN